MDQNTIERICEGLDILTDALKMDDAARLKEYGTNSVFLIIAMIRRLVEENQQ
jgi:hypothetical protein